LGVPYYRIHGTNNKSSIGKQVTHGCIRLYPDDIEHLYNEVTTGTPVRIINQPYKAGWFGGKLYVEIHPWLENTPADEVENKSILEKEIARATRGHSGYPVDWNKIMTMKQHPDGIPAVVDPGL
jgi:L,D-transpeptidase ErfK/SrfK